MKKSKIVLIGIATVVLLLLVSGVSSYNTFVAKSENIETAYSQIDNQLQRRNDLIPNLVETVKRYAEHESDVFTDIADARAKLAGAGNVAEQAEGDATLTNALSRLIAIAENYPELKANQNFIQLQDELAGTENRIAVARKDYNEMARDFNTSIRRFPANLYSNVLGFEKADYFEADEEARSNPDVGDIFGE